MGGDIDGIRSFRNIVDLKLAVCVGLRGFRRGGIGAVKSHLRAGNRPVLRIVHDAANTSRGGRKNRTERNEYKQQ